jgi:hypothetical protein
MLLSSALGNLHKGRSVHVITIIINYLKFLKFGTVLTADKFITLYSVNVTILTVSQKNADTKNT